MKTLDELDALHAAATAGPRRMVFAVRAYDAWPAFSARLRAKEAEVERLRGALLIATGRFASVAEACDIAEDALGADVVAAWNAAENARAALGEP